LTIQKPVDRQEIFGERAGAAERIAPGYFREAFEAEHVARYRWATRWIRGAVVLDVACGTGYGAPLLWDSGARRLISVDLSLPALRFGRDQYGLRAVQADAQLLPFAPESFDVVVSLETIEHVPHADRFLEEVRRVLRPDGRLLLSTPDRNYSNETNPYHVREFTLPELREILSLAGLRVDSVWGQHWKLPGAVFTRVWGLRGFAWRVEHLPGVSRVGPPGARPRVLCLSVTPG
jgi:SAM-dependent methyltransferase